MQHVSPPYRFNAVYVFLLCRLALLIIIIFSISVSLLFQYSPQSLSKWYFILGEVILLSRFSDHIVSIHQIGILSTCAPYHLRVSKRYLFIISNFVVFWTPFFRWCRRFYKRPTIEHWHSHRTICRTKCHQQGYPMKRNFWSGRYQSWWASSSAKWHWYKPFSWCCRYCRKSIDIPKRFFCFSIFKNFLYFNRRSLGSLWGRVWIFLCVELSNINSYLQEKHAFLVQKDKWNIGNQGSSQRWRWQGW